MNVQLVDAERLVVDILTDAHPAVGVGTQLPSGWSRYSTPFLRVALDVVPSSDWPVVAYCTIRVVAYGLDAPTVKALGRAAEASLLGVSTDDLPRIRPLTGVYVSTDPVNDWPIASFTVRVTARYRPI